MTLIEIGEHIISLDHLAHTGKDARATPDGKLINPGGLSLHMASGSTVWLTYAEAQEFRARIQPALTQTPSPMPGGPIWHDIHRKA